MIISEMDPSRQHLPLVQQRTAQNGTEVVRNETFVRAFGELVKDVDTLQKESGDLTARFIKGEPVDLHDVMIASEKAKTSFQLLMEMRNKFTDMYREVSRMQV